MKNIEKAFYKKKVVLPKTECCYLENSLPTLLKNLFKKFLIVCMEWHSFPNLTQAHNKQKVTDIAKAH